MRVEGRLRPALVRKGIFFVLMDGGVGGVVGPLCRDLVRDVVMR